MFHIKAENILTTCLLKSNAALTILQDFLIPYKSILAFNLKVKSTRKTIFNANSFLAKRYILALKQAPPPPPSAFLSGRFHCKHD
jgi:hypothetical protein